MKKILIPLLFVSVTAFGQFTKPQLYTGINTNIRNKTASQLRIAAMLDSIVASMELAGGSFTLTNGSGTTASGSAVNLGGALTGNVSITSDQTHNVVFGSTTYANAINNFQVFTDNNISLATGDVVGGTTERTVFDFSKSLVQLGHITAGSVINQYTLNSGGHSFTIGGSVKFRVTSGIEINTGSDATGDTYYRNSGGFFTRLPAGTNGHVLTLAAGIPSWAAPVVSDGDKGDITVSSSGTVWKVDFDVSSVTTTTHNETATSGEKIILVDAATAGGTVTVNLPTAVGNRAKIHIKKTDAGANTIIIDGSGGETIDGSVTFPIYFQYQSLTLVSNGTNWFII